MADSTIALLAALRKPAPHLLDGWQQELNGGDSLLMAAITDANAKAAQRAANDGAASAALRLRPSSLPQRRGSMPPRLRAAPQLQCGQLCRRSRLLTSATT
jgi:hypothetical protein